MESTENKKIGFFQKNDWIWPTVVIILLMKFFGIAGSLVVIGVYYWLKPKIGIWGAIAVSSVAGIAAAILLTAMIKS